MTTSRSLAVYACVSILLQATRVLAGESEIRLQPLAGALPAFQADAIPQDAGSGAPDTQEPEGPLYLQDALALALMGSPQLASFSWETRAREARTLQAAQMPNPELGVRLWRLAQPAGVPDGERRRVIFSQDFELGGKRSRRIDLAREERNIAELEYETRRIELATQVAFRFVEVVGAQRRVDSRTRSVAYLESVRSKIQALVDTGSAPRLNLHRVTRETGLARIERQKAVSELEIARFALAASWGSGAPSFSEAVGDLESLPAVPDLETVIEKARRNPATARWDAELARGRSAVALARANRVPDFELEAGVRWEDHLDPDYIVGFGISLPIFDRKQGDVREARYRLAGAQAVRQAAIAEWNQSIVEAYHALGQARTRSRAFGDEIVPSAQALFDAFVAVFETQSNDLGGLLDAGRDLADAESDFSSALVDFHQALARLEGLVGDRL